MKLIHFGIVFLFIPFFIFPHDDSTVHKKINYRRIDPSPIENYNPNDRQAHFPPDRVVTSTGVWTKLNPKVPNVDYIGIEFINKDTGWTVGSYGVILKTTDAGENWELKDTSSNEVLLRVNTFNGETLIVTGHNGLILRSTDAGETFTQVPSGMGYGYDLWGIQMLNDSVGWICGMYSTLLKTTDAGVTWNPVNTGFNTIHYWSLDFLNESYGMIVCDSGRVLRTTNGGINWTSHQAGNSWALYTIDIIDSLHVAAAGTLGKNLYSSNGGIAWVVNPLNAHAYVGNNRIQFINKDTGYSVGDRNLILKTTNRGQNWTSSIYEIGEWDLKLVTDAGYAAGSFMKLEKGDSLYEVWEELVLNDDLTAVCFVNENKGFVLSGGLHGYLYRTIDGGTNWEVIPNAPPGYSIFFLNEQIGIIGNIDTKIFKTIDGGNNWFQTNVTGLTSILEGFEDIFFIDENTGWAASVGIVKTTDGGENWWTQLNLLSYRFVTGIHFVDSLYGWASELNGKPFKTTDGGNNWIEQINLNYWGTDDVYFTSYENGFLIEFEKLYHTTNGGLQWYTQLDSDVVMRSFGMANNQHGFIMGDVIYETNDSGNTWNAIPGLRNLLRKIHLPKNYLGYATGNLGIIYKYYDSAFIPVELTSFTGEIKGNFIYLNWTTSSETNNYGFEILRCTDKENWHTIGFVRGYGTSIDIHFYEYTDKLDKHGKHYYRLKQLDLNGNYKYSSTIEANLEAPQVFNLHQNYPNPFNPITTINYSLPQTSKVELKVYDILGKEIITLVNDLQETGNYEVKFNASNLASGLYFYRITAGDYINTKKLLLLK